MKDKKILKHKFKKYIAVGLISVLTLGGSKSLKQTSSTNSKEDLNTIGYTNIIPNFFNRKVNNNNFVILDIGDSLKTGTKDLEKKIEYCNNHDIALGLIVSPSSLLLSDIYDDIELVKGIIDKYKVSFPIYLNIDNIIENTTIDNDNKTKIIETFLNKCISNGICASVYGKDTNLVYLRKYCGLIINDSFLVMDNEDITYEGTYNVYKDLDGNTKSKIDLEKIIMDNDLNNSNNFLSDGYYIVSDNDSLLDVSMKCNLSIDTLLEYNNISKEELESGMVLRIPSSYNEIISASNIKEYSLLEKPIRGCDLSELQNYIDWQAIKNNFDFVILRCQYGDYIDSSFNNNLANCNYNNIPVGVYCFNTYRGIDYKDNPEKFQEAILKQANLCVYNISNKNIIYPIYFDLEINSNENISDIYSKDQIKIMLDTWKEKITDSGHIAGLYCSKSVYEYINSFYDTSNLSIWLAYYKDDQELSLDQIEAPTNRSVSYNNKQYNFDIIQSYRYVTNAGASNDFGHLDINYSFIDYSKPINNNKYSFSYKNIERKEPDFLGASLLVGGGIIGSIACNSFMNYPNAKKRTKKKN